MHFIARGYTINPTGTVKTTNVFHFLGPLKAGDLATNTRKHQDSRTSDSMAPKVVRCLHPNIVRMWSFLC